MVRFLVSLLSVSLLFGTSAAFYAQPVPHTKLVHIPSAFRHTPERSRRGRGLATASMHGEIADEGVVLNRARFLATAAVGAISLIGGCSPVSAAHGDVRVPRFLDTDIIISDGVHLSIRQQYGMPRQSEEDSMGGGDRQGTYVWPASQDMGKYLLSDAGRIRIKGKRVLEMGAGTGIGGMSAFIGGAFTVALTDGSPEVLSVTRDSLVRNKLQLEDGRVCVDRLRWGNEQDIAALQGGWDVVIGSEITYLSASIDPMLGTMRKLFATPSSVGLLTYTPELVAFDGGGVLELERKAATHGLKVTHLKAPSSNPDADTEIILLSIA